MLSSNVFGETITINWASINAPPFFVYTGQYAHEGICDLLINELIGAIPDVNHQLLALPNLRLKRKMQDGEKICLPCMIHQNDNHSGIIYSDPSIVYLPHVLIMRAPTRERFIHEFSNPTSLESLLESNKYRLGQHSGRKFAADIQSIVDKHLQRGLEVPNEVGSTTSLLMLVSLNRVDFTIDYPSTLSYYNKTNHKPLSWLPIQENKESVVLGAVGCSGPDGDTFKQEAINKINQALPDILASEHYQQSVKKWFEDTDPDYLKKYRKYLLTR